MKQGDIVEHKSKESTSGYPHNKKYIYLKDVRCKDRTSGEWYDAVLYAEFEGEGLAFVREKNDFMDQFKEEEQDDTK